MDARDRWLGIRKMKQAYSPLPESWRAPAGDRVGPSQILIHTGTHLATQQFASPDPPFPPPEGPPICTCLLYTSPSPRDSTSS
eukprot:8834275-Prorocentrum_lima.AAC.1